VIKWLKSYLLMEKEVGSNSYRREVTGNFVILFSFAILFLLTLSNFFLSSLTIFYANLALFSGLCLITFLFRRNKRLVIHSIAHFMAGGIFVIVYFNQAQDYTPIWSFLYMYLIISLYGHQKGLIIAGVFLGCLLLFLSFWVGETVTKLEFIRFAFVSVFILFFAYLAELLISRTFEQLNKTKSILEKMTITDELTGLHNRRHFNDMLSDKINSARRSKEMLALAIIDVDHFKKYNDTYGHPAGDQVLIALAELLKITMKRSDDVLFRLGGEEFALLYKPKDETAAIALLERIRKAVEVAVKEENIQSIVTISAGLYIIKPQKAQTFEEVYKSADELLYQAKELGRNRVVVSP